MTTEIKNTEQTPKYRRAGLMDEIRGFCIICMVFYHVMFDLNYTYNIHIPIMFDDWFGIIRDIFAGTFMFISGMSCRYSRNNAKRGIQCFFIAMAITYVFAIISPGAPILFGILHFMGVSMMIYAVAEKLIVKIHPLIGAGVCVVLFLATMGFTSGYFGLGEFFGLSIPELFYESGLLFPFGITGQGFISMDYFPLFPWLFVFLAGGFLGYYAVNDKFPEFFYKTHIKPLAVIGRYTIWIYILHQPMAMAIFWLIFGR